MALIYINIKACSFQLNFCTSSSFFLFSSGGRKRKKDKTGAKIQSKRTGFRIIIYPIKFVIRDLFALLASFASQHIFPFLHLLNIIYIYLSHFKKFLEISIQIDLLYRSKIENEIEIIQSRERKPIWK